MPAVVVKLYKRLYEVLGFRCWLIIKGKAYFYFLFFTGSCWERVGERLIRKGHGIWRGRI
jgi:hypothetical protein